jgi:hypothetical protein
VEGRTLVSIAGGWRHSVAVDTAGLLYAWGWNKVRARPRITRLLQCQCKRERGYLGAIVSLASKYAGLRLHNSRTLLLGWINGLVIM